MERLLQELHQGKNLDKNLKEYKELALETYEAYSVLELTFSAYGLVEEISEDKKLAEDAGKGQFEKIKQGLLKLSDPAADYAKLGQEMEELRSRITEKMNLFTAYTDRLIVFEYVLNRMEYQYLSEKERKDKLNGIKQEEFLQKLQRYLFSDKDTSVMQEKIRLVAGQLPVRMTRESSMIVSVRHLLFIREVIRPRWMVLYMCWKRRELCISRQNRWNSMRHSGICTASWKQRITRIWM